jgi:hypothetical protein
VIIFITVFKSFDFRSGSRENRSHILLKPSRAPPETTWRLKRVSETGVLLKYFASNWELGAENPIGRSGHRVRTQRTSATGPHRIAQSVS